MNLIKSLKVNVSGKHFPRLSKFKKWILTYKVPKSTDFSLLRISPIDTSATIKERFIPLARNTVIRKLSQNLNFISKLNQPLFEDFNRYLDACITNRNFFFLKEIKSSYEHLNPDVEVVSGGLKWIMQQRQILDEEFWFMQKLSRMLELANFKEMSRSELETVLKKPGGYSAAQIWVDLSKYELVKVWVLGRENRIKSGRLRTLMDKYFPWGAIVTAIGGNPWKSGHNYRRVAIAVRVKKSGKIDLKLFKDLSEGELIHMLPEVEIGHSQIDNGILVSTGILMVLGVGSHFALPAATISSGWLLTSSHQLTTSLAVLSGMVGLINWHVIQQKKARYWKCRSELNYQSIVANNRGVIGLLGDRANDELFKESVLAYVTILAKPNGMTQQELESAVKEWAVSNSSPEFKETSVDLEINLTEALSLLRQLNIVSVDQSNNITARPLISSTAILGAEFDASNLSLELDGYTVIRNDINDPLVAEPKAESYENIGNERAK